MKTPAKLSAYGAALAQPYLAAYGHLVALREGDLAYLHVHPEGEPGDGRTPAGPQIQFVAEVPTANSYRAYFSISNTTGSCARQSSQCPPVPPSRMPRPRHQPRPMPTTATAPDRRKEAGR